MQMEKGEKIWLITEHGLSLSHVSSSPFSTPLVLLINLLEKEKSKCFCGII